MGGDSPLTPAEEKNPATVPAAPRKAVVTVWLADEGNQLFSCEC